MDELTSDEGECPPAGGLAGLLHPLTEPEFLRHRLGTEPVLIRGEDERFRGLFGWDDLNEILAAHRADATRTHLVRSAGGIALATCSRPVPQLAPRGRPSRLDPELLQQALAAGATLVVDGIEEMHAPLRTLVAGVERSLGALVQANLYANLGGAAQGFHTHWDDHDVLVLQTEGAKHWDLHPPTLDHPVGVLSDPPRPAEGVTSWSGELTRGDVLYLPRGWWHTVRAVPGRPSAHLTLGSRLPSAGDLLRRLLVRLAVEQPAVRRDLPRFADERTAADWYAQLRGALTDAVAEPGLLEKLAAELDEGAPARARFTLPHGIPGEAPR
ncbi:JmjC domain-containing protein [Kitasatospora sp. NPDC057015]|uniref:JmjC domain-containing protein n=1 Tax=Kitasatospora sp. NPDC057015 TaxID=3346001 RepID=UPI0036361723